MQRWLGLGLAVTGCIHPIEGASAGEPKECFGDPSISKKFELKAELCSSAVEINVVILNPPVEECHAFLVELQVGYRNHYWGFHNKSWPHHLAVLERGRGYDIGKVEITREAGAAEPVSINRGSNPHRRGRPAVPPSKNKLNAFETTAFHEVVRFGVFMSDVGSQFEARSVPSFPKGPYDQGGANQAQPYAPGSIISGIASSIRRLPLSAKIAAEILVLVWATRVLFSGYLDIADGQYRSRGVRSHLNGLTLTGLGAWFWWIASPS